MKPMTLARIVILSAVLCALVAACGSGESSPSPAQQSTPIDEAARLAFDDPFEAGVTSLSLSASADFNSSTGETRIFAAVRDQDGGSLIDFDFNEYNFAVTMEPGTAPYTLDPAVTSLDRATVGDVVVAMVIDSSGSMSTTTETGQARIDVAKEAAGLFVGLMEAGDRTAVVDFDSSARTVQPLTDDQALLESAIDQFAADGATNIGAAVQEAVRAVGSYPGRRAVVLLTDGDDTVDTVTGGPEVWMQDSASTRFQGLKLAQQAELRVYTVGLGDGLSEQGLADLNTFASETGGSFFLAPTAASLLTAFQQTIPAELAQLPPQQTFVLSFESPVQHQDGKPITVPFRLAILYANANGTLGGKASGTYLVP